MPGADAAEHWPVSGGDRLGDLPQLAYSKVRVRAAARCRSTAV